jgi:diguanylate cyclase (GGDEF)-like protein
MSSPSELAIGSSRAGRRWQGTAAAAGGLLVAYLLWQITRLGGSRHQVLIGDLANIPFYVLVIGATALAGRRCRATPGLARSWRLLAVGNACYLMGDLLQTYQEVVNHRLAYPSVADIAYLSFYGFFFAGLVGFARSARSNDRRVMFGLDLVTVAIGGAAVLWYFVAGPSALADGLPPLQVILAIAYPLGDLLLLLGATATLLWGLPSSSKRALSVTTAGVGLYVLADVIWGYIVLHGTYRGGDRVDTLWIAAATLFAVGAALQPATQPAERAAPIAVARRGAGWLPYGALGATFALLLVVQRHAPFFPDLSITVMAVAVAMVVGARQLVAQRALADEQATSQELMVRLRHQAFHDDLTGIANRALFKERLDHALSRRPVPGAHPAVLIIDLDGFKSVNDHFGHDTGDQLLIAVAERLRSCVRRADTAARLGGDEFVVLIEDVADAAAALQIGRHILSVIGQPLTLGDLDILPRASIGIAVRRGGETLSSEALLGAADEAMYQAKDRGRGRVCLFGDLGDEDSSLRAATLVDYARR